MPPESSSINISDLIRLNPNALIGLSARVVTCKCMFCSCEGTTTQCAESLIGEIGIIDEVQNLSLHLKFDKHPSGVFHYSELELVF